MGRRVFGLVALAAGVFAAGSAGQEAVTYKKYADKPGDRTRVTKTETTATDTVFTVMGQEQKKGEKKVKTLVYVNEVVTPAQDGGRPVKLKRTYETVTEAKDGGPAAKLPLAGKTVVIEKQGDKYTFADDDGKALPKVTAADLDNEFNKRGEDFGTDGLFPDKPIKPGDTWDATAKLLKAVAGPDAPFVPVEGKAKVTAKLLKVAREGGRTVGDVQVKGDIPISELRAAKGPMIKLTGDSGLKVDLTGRGVLDGSAPDGSATGKLTVTVDGEVQGIGLKVTAVVDTVSKTELLKK
ncbi:MAG: hypothetical protein K2X82_18010 [Gemmataceae bacterium]|nr:hypothetical protein [Gemmataceae bacterium]